MSIGWRMARAASKRSATVCFVAIWTSARGHRGSYRVMRGDDHADRVLRGRIGAYRLHAGHDPRETTAKARAAFASSFERQVDPAGLLAPAERLRRAEAARKAYFVRLARLSARARRKRRSSPQ